MKPAPFALLADLASDPVNGWSIGSFGAIGEFVRDADEPVTIARKVDAITVVTARGAMRIKPLVPLQAIAWDSLAADGESWGHALAFCVARPATPNRVIISLGPDRKAIRKEDRGAAMFDLGVAAGAVHMCLRTRDAALIAALDAAQGNALLDTPGIMAEVLRAQPHRVMLSPAGRIEVFQPIPPADGKSPEGPHTHLLPKLIAKDRTHSSNTPLPDGLQSALTAHPRSPWRTMLGERYPFDPSIDAVFQPLLATYGLPEDMAVHAAITGAVAKGQTPTWPETRRGRTKARIVLRRLAATGVDVQSLRALHDRAPLEIEEGEEP
ncbi:DUF6925 family protein [Sphingobium boeckii]|uniref:Uncharacterized protein n=1 Tax=Sphingobium boeckii TaxID=1082345 RepID=A0A7W9AJ88_9SPHN|nr:hypothetical protein [Sphingobium boeckii]MBB5686491.1 hypothetical protein [Sphingobium boeckii]